MSIRFYNQFNRAATAPADEKAAKVAAPKRATKPRTPRKPKANA